MPTAGLLVQVYDNASPRNAIAAGWTVNSSTFDVIITFASPQSNYYVVINGATGPARDRLGLPVSGVLELLTSSCTRQSRQSSAAALVPPAYYLWNTGSKQGNAIRQ